MNTHTRLLTRKDLADQFRVSPAAVDAWRRAGQIRVVRTPGGRVRFLLTPELEALMFPREDIGES